MKLILNDYIGCPVGAIVLAVQAGPFGLVVAFSL